jgi:hypothetical protein
VRRLDECLEFVVGEQERVSRCAVRVEIDQQGRVRFVREVQVEDVWLSSAPHLDSAWFGR